VFAESVHGFVNRHPTIKMLALAFLLLIGVALVADGVGFHIPKGYIYGSMAFATLVELLNIRLRRRGAPVRLHEPHVGAERRCEVCGQTLT
jgi:predicted tellurium resistance membrane protein TerC